MDQGRISKRCTRREALLLLASSAVLAACGDHHKAPVTAPTASTTGGSTTVSSTAGTTTPATTSVEIGGSAAPADDQVTAGDVAQYATDLTGHWQGGWHDSANRSGDTDAVISFDAATKQVTLVLSFDGPILGGNLPSITYRIDLADFSLQAATWIVPTPQFGRLTLTGLTQATATAIPGHPEISSIDLAAALSGQRFDVTYTIHENDGHETDVQTINGTMAWSRGAVRAEPAPIGTGGQTTPAAISSGTYAAGLLTAAQVTTAFGEPVSAPQANGGRLNYDLGIDLSNGLAVARSGDYQVSYTICVGQSPAATKAFWQKQLLGLPNVSGPWEAAFFQQNPPTLYAELPTHVLKVEIDDLRPTGVATATQEASWQNIASQIASDLVTSLHSS